VKNSILHSPFNKNSELISNKTEKELHGYGIKTIKTIADKYEGSAEFYTEDELFCCHVVLRRNTA
jgi:sensor histidine kinase YesM